MMEMFYIFVRLHYTTTGICQNSWNYDTEDPCILLYVNYTPTKNKYIKREKSNRHRSEKGKVNKYSKKFLNK